MEADHPFPLLPSADHQSHDLVEIQAGGIVHHAGYSGKQGLGHQTTGVDDAIRLPQQTLALDRDQFRVSGSGPHEKDGEAFRGLLHVFLTMMVEK